MCRIRHCYAFDCMVCPAVIEKYQVIVEQLPVIQATGGDNSPSIYTGVINIFAIKAAFEEGATGKVVFFVTDKGQLVPIIGVICFVSILMHTFFEINY